HRLRQFRRRGGRQRGRQGQGQAKQGEDTHGLGRSSVDRAARTSGPITDASLRQPGYTVKENRHESAGAGDAGIPSARGPRLWTPNEEGFIRRAGESGAFPNGSAGPSDKTSFVRRYSRQHARREPLKNEKHG